MLSRVRSGHGNVGVLYFRWRPLREEASFGWVAGVFDREAGPVRTDFCRSLAAASFSTKHLAPVQGSV